MAVYSVYFSPTGGVKAVMDQLVSAWPQATGIDLSDPHFDPTRYSFTPQDICLVGAPAFEGRVPKLQTARLRLLQGGGAKAVAVAVYGNRAIDDTLVELADTLTEAGFVCCAGVKAVAHHSLFTQYAVGRPDAGDAAQLQEFSRRLKQAAEADTAAAPVLPGSRPYRALTPSTFFPRMLHPEACTRCGLCAARCPASAIRMEDPAWIDTEQCARCMRCVTFCPAGALGMDPARMEALNQRIAPLFEGRKPNELYL